jgi:uncharacterized protein
VESGALVNRRNRRAGNARVRHLPVVHRSCGKCDACCEALGVPELDKAFQTPCQHSQKPGCRIYANRPESCRLYECLWLQGAFEPEDRPDKSGIVVDVSAENGILGPAGEVIVAREAFDGAYNKAEAQALMRQMPPTFSVYVVLRDGRRIVISAKPVRSSA